MVTLIHRLSPSFPRLSHSVRSAHEWNEWMTSEERDIIRFTSCFSSPYVLFGWCLSPSGVTYAPPEIRTEWVTKGGEERVSRSVSVTRVFRVYLRSWDSLPPQSFHSLRSLHSWGEWNEPKACNGREESDTVSIVNEMPWGGVTLFPGLRLSLSRPLSRLRLTLGLLPSGGALLVGGERRKER